MPAAWTEHELVTRSRREEPVSSGAGILFEQGVKPGDLVTTKLLAVDLKGHRAESRPIQITIIASGFETKRLTSLETLRALYAAFVELRTAGEAFEKRAGEARELFERAARATPSGGRLASAAARRWTISSAS